MEQETENLLVLISRTIRFATDHPYAATGIFGAMVGSAVTYKVLADNPQASTRMFTSRTYELVLSAHDLHQLLDKPGTELRWEISEGTVVITSEKIEPLKQLPDIEYNPEEQGES